MKHLFISLLCVTIGVLAARPASAADCYVDYKAKQDSPLRLHYGVAQIYGECSTDAAQNELAPRLAMQGWILLTVLSTFDAKGLDERKESAGAYFLHF